MAEQVQVVVEELSVEQPAEDDGALLVQQVLEENPPEERGVRSEWEDHVGWHVKENIRGQVRKPKLRGTKLQRESLHDNNNNNNNNLHSHVSSPERVKQNETIFLNAHQEMASSSNVAGSRSNMFLLLGTERILWLLVMLGVFVYYYYFGIKFGFSTAKFSMRQRPYNKGR